MTGTIASTVGRAKLGGPDAGSVRRVLICDDRSITGLTLTKAIRIHPTEPEIRCVSDGFALTDAFAEQAADLVMIGYRVGAAGGPRATDLLLGLFPTAPVIAFGSANASSLLVAAVARGVRGVMLWTPYYADPGRNGPPGLPRSASERHSMLTERELQVLDGMTQGRSNSEIGRDLYLSEDTIKTIARRLFHKLGARDRAHAVALGIRNSYVT